MPDKINAFQFDGSLKALTPSSDVLQKADQYNSTWDLETLKAVLIEKDRAAGFGSAIEVDFYFKFDVNINSFITHSGSVANHDDRWDLATINASQNFTNTPEKFRLPESANFAKLTVALVDFRDKDVNGNPGPLLDTFRVYVEVKALQNGKMQAQSDVEVVSAPINNPASIVEDTTKAQVLYINTRANEAVYGGGRTTATSPDKLSAAITISEVRTEIDNNRAIGVRDLANLYDGKPLLNLANVQATMDPISGPDNKLTLFARQERGNLQTNAVFRQGELVVLKDPQSFDPKIECINAARNGVAKSVDLLSEPKNIFAVFMQTAAGANNSDESNDPDNGGGNEEDPDAPDLPGNGPGDIP